MAIRQERHKPAKPFGHWIQFVRKLFIMNEEPKDYEKTKGVTCDPQYNHRLANSQLHRKNARKSIHENVSSSVA